MAFSIPMLCYDTDLLGQACLDPDAPEVVAEHQFWQVPERLDGDLHVVTDVEQEKAFLDGQLGMCVRTSVALANCTAQSSLSPRTATFPARGDQPRRTS